MLSQTEITNLDFSLHLKYTCSITYQFLLKDQKRQAKSSGGIIFKPWASNHGDFAKVQFDEQYSSGEKLDLLKDYLKNVFSLYIVDSQHKHL